MDTKSLLHEAKKYFGRAIHSSRLGIYPDEWLSFHSIRTAPHESSDVKAVLQNAEGKETEVSLIAVVLIFEAEG